MLNIKIGPVTVETATKRASLFKRLEAQFLNELWDGHRSKKSSERADRAYGQGYAIRQR